MLREWLTENNVLILTPKDVSYALVAESVGPCTSQPITATKEMGSSTQSCFLAFLFKLEGHHDLGVAALNLPPYTLFL